jgi:hypothetical protein
MGRQVIGGKSFLCEAANRRDAGVAGLSPHPRRLRNGRGDRQPHPVHLQRPTEDGFAAKGASRRHEPNWAWASFRRHLLQILLGGQIFVTPIPDISYKFSPDYYNH